MAGNSNSFQQERAWEKLDVLTIAYTFFILNFCFSSMLIDLYYKRSFANDPLSTIVVTGDNSKEVNIWFDRMTNIHKSHTFGKRAAVVVACLFPLHEDDHDTIDGTAIIGQIMVNNWYM